MIRHPASFALARFAFAAMLPTSAALLSLTAGLSLTAYSNAHAAQHDAPRSELARGDEIVPLILAENWSELSRLAEQTGPISFTPELLRDTVGAALADLRAQGASFRDLSLGIRTNALGGHICEARFFEPSDMGAVGVIRLEVLNVNGDWALTDIATSVGTPAAVARGIAEECPSLEPWRRMDTEEMPSIPRWAGDLAMHLLRGRTDAFFDGMLEHLPESEGGEAMLASIARDRAQFAQARYLLSGTSPGYAVVRRVAPHIACAVFPFDASGKRIGYAAFWLVHREDRWLLSRYMTNLKPGLEVRAAAVEFCEPSPRLADAASDPGAYR